MNPNYEWTDRHNLRLETKVEEAAEMIVKGQSVSKGEPLSRLAMRA